jgi:hypothetical protein
VKTINFKEMNNDNNFEKNYFRAGYATAPAILEMKPFEDDLFNLIENIKFRNAVNEFQEFFANDFKKIN